MQGKEPDRGATASARYGVRIIPTILDGIERGLQIVDARMTLEVAAAEASIRRHDKTSIAELRRILFEMERAHARPERFALKNREFCRALFARCDNDFMRQLIEELWDQVWQAGSIYVFELMHDRVAPTMDENKRSSTRSSTGTLGA